MSLSFYYVVTYNIQHPTVKKLLGNLISISDSLIEFKSRSKLFHDVSEVSEAVHNDFDLKLEKMYLDVEHQSVQCITAINPLYNTEPLEEGAEAFVTSDWDENCTGAIFFVEVDDIDEDEDEEDVMITMEPNSWMVKYEMFVVEDAMEIPCNGDAAFSFVEAGLTTSTYH